MTSGAIQYGVPFIDLAPDIVAYNNQSNQIKIRRDNKKVKYSQKRTLVGKTNAMESKVYVPAQQLVLMPQNQQV